PPRSTLFPYTTLFRSRRSCGVLRVERLSARSRVLRTGGDASCFGRRSPLPLSPPLVRNFSGGRDRLGFGRRAGSELAHALVRDGVPDTNLQAGGLTTPPVDDLPLVPQEGGVMIKALVFDVDGTLAETEEGHRQAFNAAFAEAGLDWVWDVDLYRDLHRVTGGKERMRHYAERRGVSAAELSDADIARLHARKNARYAELVRAGQCPLRPGVERL